MLNIKKERVKVTAFVLLSAFIFTFISCSDNDNGLAPYMGATKLSTVKVEEGTFMPKITWVGGYASVIGTNIGEHAILDTSIVWLIKSNGNDLKYPLQFGAVPAGAQNIISEVNGNPKSQLNEDNTYTYWVVRDYMWDQISKYKGKVLAAAPSTQKEMIVADGDTIRLSSEIFTIVTQRIDRFINITGVSTFGRLGQIEIINPVDTLGPMIRWTISQAGVTDSKISAIGITNGQQYIATEVLWEAWSEQSTSDGNVYGKKNVISAPVHPGESFDGVKTFYEMPAEGLVRGNNYYLWIANENWDGKGRTRVTNYYAYITFKVL
ncbi:MAG: hypothetical protein M0P71_14035 [Melioribacteraceae bacterium]|nr:hypothetical protein [Melioribacteraceae bacterium]